MISAAALAMTTAVAGFAYAAAPSGPTPTEDSSVVSTVTSALADRRCPREHAIWITETGVGPAPGGFSIARGITSANRPAALARGRCTLAPGSIAMTG